MKTMWDNATVSWDEREIILRENLIRECYEIVRAQWESLNRAVRFARVETPILTPLQELQSHEGAGFPLIKAEHQASAMRPETTAGCVAAFHAMFPMANQRAKQLPFCVWQAGKSFRDEANSDSMRASKLRLREFWQLEFQLFVAEDTKASYLSHAMDALAERFGGVSRALHVDEMPHYSRATVDWEIGGVEISSASIRTDWPEGEIHEVSIGLDRLLRTLSQEGEG